MTKFKENAVGWNFKRPTFPFVVAPSAKCKTGKEDSSTEKKKKLRIH